VPIRVASHAGTVRLIAAALLAAACDYAYPEVVVVNEIADTVLVRSISFNGCKWDEMLGHEQATSPGRCLPGTDHVHFQRFDAADYCQQQVEDDNLPALCFCDEQDAPAEDSHDLGIIDRSPLWFSYQTVSTKRVQYGSFHRFLLRSDDLEQDFSVPGPYGH
jgi:hypothetical protein